MTSLSNLMRIWPHSSRLWLPFWWKFLLQFVFFSQFVLWKAKYKWSEAVYTILQCIYIIFEINTCYKYKLYYWLALGLASFFQIYLWLLMFFYVMIILTMKSRFSSDVSKLQRFCISTPRWLWVTYAASKIQSCP